MLVDGNVDRVDATHIYVADCEYCTTHMDIYIMSVSINNIHCTQIMKVCYDYTMYLYFSWCWLQIMDVEFKVKVNWIFM